MISASLVPLRLACPGSHRLPQSPYQTEHAEAGTDRHADMESAADIGDETKLPPEVQALIRTGDMLATECAFAYDVSTGAARELGHIKKRAYQNLAPFEIPGTTDLLIRGSRRMVIVDYKGFEEVTGADENAQTLTYALMVARTYGLDEVTVAIVYLASPRRPSIATIGALDLDVHAERLAQLVVDVAAPEAPLVTGPQCRYCHAFLSCPRQQEIKARFSTDLVHLEAEQMIPFQNDDDASEAAEILARLKLFTARLSAALYARAKERPIPLRNGRMLGEVQKLGKREIDADAAYKAIRARYGQEVADASVQRKVAQKWIEDALKAAGVAQPGKAKDALVKELEKAGAVIRETKTVIEEFDPELKLVESA